MGVKHKKGYAVSLGIQEYGEVFKLQAKVNSARQRNLIPDTLIFLEHHPCFTIGRAGGFDHILAGKQALDEKKIRVYETNRGGDVTYHGPGQLVCYPIIDLKNFGGDVHVYARNLEEVIIRTLKFFGIISCRKKGYPGVWVGQRKISAQGITVDKWITMHGFSLNVCPEMAHFSLIVPCGLTQYGVVSMQECLGKTPVVAAVMSELRKHLSDVFAIELHDVVLGKILELIGYGNL